MRYTECYVAYNKIRVRNNEVFKTIQKGDTFKSRHCCRQCNHHCAIMISYNYRNNYRPIEHRKYIMALLIIFLNTSREYIKATKKLDFPSQRMPLNAINRTFLDEYSNVFIRK